MCKEMVCQQMATHIDGCNCQIQPLWSIESVWLLLPWSPMEISHKNRVWQHFLHAQQHQKSREHCLLNTFSIQDSQVKVVEQAKVKMYHRLTAMCSKRLWVTSFLLVLTLAWSILGRSSARKSSWLINCNAKRK